MSSARPRDGRGRPLLEGALRDLLRGLVRANPEGLGHVDVDRIVIVAGAARRGARASIRPLTFGGTPPRLAANGARKPAVGIGGKPMLYELCLRPLYFLGTTVDARLEILAHELWHTSLAFDGALDPARRHAAADPDESASFARDAADRARRAEVDQAALAHDGEVRLPMWLDRPPSVLPPRHPGRDAYDERDLFLAVVRQRRLPISARASETRRRR